MAFRKDRVKPTHYPQLPFHLIRSAQLVASLVVSSIMVYFMRELAHDSYKLPWTFILLFAVSVMTVVSLSATIVLHCLHGLNPVLNTVLNSSLALLWALSFALLAWWSSSTLSHVCNVDNWDSELGISVCRLYKALFSFDLLGLVATLAALGLDIRVQRNATMRGRFQPLDVLNSRGKTGAQVLHHEEDEANQNQTAAWTQQGQRDHGGGGYELPEEQFAYEDTAYGGAAGQMGRRSLDGRM